jgi:hypothetical protein
MTWIDAIEITLLVILVDRNLLIHKRYRPRIKIINSEWKKAIAFDIMEKNEQGDFFEWKHRNFNFEIVFWKSK